MTKIARSILRHFSARVAYHLNRITHSLINPDHNVTWCGLLSQSSCRY